MTPPPKSRERKCRHPERSRDARVWLRTVTGGYRWFAAYLDDPERHAEVCADCGAWLSLGPANDSDERVALEISAVELSLSYTDASWDGFVSLGMCSPEAQHAPMIEADIAAGRKPARDLADYYAGHLAAVIATHDEGSE